MPPSSRHLRTCSVPSIRTDHWGHQLLYRLLISATLLADVAAAQSPDSARGLSRDVPACAAKAPSPRQAHAQCVDVGVRLAQSGRPAQAAEAFAFAAGLDSSDVDARYNAGLMLEVMGRHERALQFFEDAAEIGAPDASLLWHIGANRYQLGVYAGARDAFLAALRQDSTDLQILVDLAVVEGRMGNTASACIYWKDVASRGRKFLSGLPEDQRQSYERFFKTLTCS